MTVSYPEKSAESTGSQFKEPDAIGLRRIADAREAIDINFKTLSPRARLVADLPLWGILFLQTWMFLFFYYLYPRLVSSAFAQGFQLPGTRVDHTALYVKGGIFLLVLAFGFLLRNLGHRYEKLGEGILLAAVPGGFGMLAAEK